MPWKDVRAFKAFKDLQEPSSWMIRQRTLRPFKALRDLYGS
jgi:hypothetical protein